MSSTRRFLYMFALVCMWSPSFLFIKLAVEDLPPMTVVTLRVLLAAIALIGILYWKGISLPRDRVFWIKTFIMASFASMIPFCLFCYAEKTIDSALAAILNGTSPMFTAVFAQIFVASDRLSIQKTFGILLSSFGIVFLFAPQLAEGVSGTTLGMSAGMLASVCYSISHVYGKLNITGQKPFVAPASQMIASAVMLFPLTLYYDQPWTLPVPSVSAISSVCSLALFGTVVAFIIYYRLLEHCGPTAMSMVSCMFPIGGMLLGFVFLGERFTMTSFLASLVIITGMLAVNNVISFKSLLPKREPQQEISDN